MLGMKKEGTDDVMLNKIKLRNVVEQVLILKAMS